MSWTDLPPSLKAERHGAVAVLRLKRRPKRVLPIAVFRDFCNKIRQLQTCAWSSIGTCHAWGKWRAAFKTQW
jgi:hypothetical protein